MMLTKLIIKEIKQEIRSKDIILSMFVFSISIILSFQFIFSVSSYNNTNLIIGLIWLVYIFSSILGLYKIMATEREMGGFVILLTSPIERGLIYIAKVISFSLLLLIIELISFPIFVLFYDISVSKVNLISLITVLINNWALAASGVLISSIAYHTRASEIVIPIIFFPVISPILISSSKISISVINGLAFNEYSFWVLISITFCLIFTALGYILFEYICEE
tara:strand:+ start:1528 stop:2193 length:666 start_codon:yes stop_codon:yes gene_type:complete